jgi:hypothetical protein
VQRGENLFRCARRRSVQTKQDVCPPQYYTKRIYVTHSAVLRFFKPLLYAAFLRCLLILGGRPHKFLLEAMMAVKPSSYMAGCCDVLHQFGNSTWGRTEQLIIKRVRLHCLLLKLQVLNFYVQNNQIKAILFYIL